MSHLWWHDSQQGSAEVEATISQCYFTYKNPLIWHHTPIPYDNSQCISAGVHAYGHTWLAYSLIPVSSINATDPSVHHRRCLHQQLPANSYAPERPLHQPSCHWCSTGTTLWEPYLATSPVTDWPNAGQWCTGICQSSDHCCQWNGPDLLTSSQAIYPLAQLTQTSTLHSSLSAEPQNPWLLT